MVHIVEMFYLLAGFLSEYTRVARVYIVCANIMALLTQKRPTPPPNALCL